MIAALYVDGKGCYADLDGVECWDEKRDARLYAGPWPVVAHPPCTRWCRLAGLVEARWGHKRGEDDGCFEAALNAVRTWGGVLEHPAYTDAWAAFGLVAPPTGGGWVRSLICGGWACYVEQQRYGHAARKATWLYYHGYVPPTPMRWGHLPNGSGTALVSWCGNHVASGEDRPRLGKKAANATPHAFRDALLELARMARPLAASPPQA